MQEESPGTREFYDLYTLCVTYVPTYWVNQWDRSRSCRTNNEELSHTHCRTDDGVTTTLAVETFLVSSIVLFSIYFLQNAKATSVPAERGELRLSFSATTFRRAFLRSSASISLWPFIWSSDTPQLEI